MLRQMKFCETSSSLLIYDPAIERLTWRPLILKSRLMIRKMRPSCDVIRFGNLIDEVSCWSIHILKSRLLIRKMRPSCDVTGFWILSVKSREASVAGNQIDRTWRTLLSASANIGSSSACQTGEGKIVSHWKRLVLFYLVLSPDL